MDDLISREVVLKELEEYLVNPETAISVYPDDIHNYNSGLLTAIQAVTDIPSAQPKRKKGKWIKIPEFCGDDVSGFIDNHFSCSECKKEAEINSWGFYILSDFCPHCGADMREEKIDDTN